MKKKILALVLVFALALALGIGGTMAWLTAETGSVTNTFTVGNIELILTEQKVVINDNGEEKIVDITADNKNFKVLPGATASKNPVLTVSSGSEKCYVYACITNTVKIDGTVVATPNINTDDTSEDGYWIVVKTQEDKTLYRWSKVVDASVEKQTINVFTEVTYDGELITLANKAAVEAGSIIIEGFAHQSEHTDSTTADDAAVGHFWPSAS